MKNSQDCKKDARGKETTQLCCAAGGKYFLPCARQTHLMDGHWICFVETISSRPWQSAPRTLIGLRHPSLSDLADTRASILCLYDQDPIVFATRLRRRRKCVAFLARSLDRAGRRDEVPLPWIVPTCHHRLIGQHLQIKRYGTGIRYVDVAEAAVGSQCGDGRFCSSIGYEPSHGSLGDSSWGFCIEQCRGRPLSRELL